MHRYDATSIFLLLIHFIGIVIDGASGNGKTLLANYIAYQNHTKFKFLSISCADLIHKIVGISEQLITNIFQSARSIAPCFILLDNIEIILGNNCNESRKRTENKAIDRILSTLLIEIDGLMNSKNNSAPVIIIATTIDYKLLNRALIRPNRLEEHITISHPTCQQVSFNLQYEICSFKFAEN